MEKHSYVSTLKSIAGEISAENKIQRDLAKSGKGWQNREFCDSVDREMEWMTQFAKVSRELKDIGGEKEVKKILNKMLKDKKK